MSGYNEYNSNFLNYTIDYLNSYRLTENDIISVQVKSDIVTWECFKESVKDIPWDTYNNDKLIIEEIQIYGKNFIMFLNHDPEYCAYSWDILYIPDNLEPNKETKYVNVSKVKQIM